MRIFLFCVFVLINIGTISAQFKLNTNAIGRIFKSPNDSTSIGSAFVAGRSKAIYTCSHVAISDTLWFSYIGRDILFKIRVTYNLPSYDIAFLERTGGAQPTSLDFGDFSRVQPGDIIFYIGWDVPQNNYLIRQATVSAKGSVLLEEGAKVDFIEFEGEAIPGYSGGPVLDNAGKVVAIIREGWTRTSLKGGPSVRINRAFSIELLKVLDSELKIHTYPGSNNSAKSLIDLKN